MKLITLCDECVLGFAFPVKKFISFQKYFFSNFFHAKRCTRMYNIKKQKYCHWYSFKLIFMILNFRLETVQTIFVFVACVMGALGLMILFVGFLTTGATRHKVYRAWRARIGGRISCIVVRKYVVT